MKLIERVKIKKRSDMFFNLLSAFIGMLIVAIAVVVLKYFV